MSSPAAAIARALTLVTAPPPLIVPDMSNGVDRHSRVRLTSRGIELGGRVGIPVTGELHFSRIPRARWEEELRLVVASGLTSVSTYVFWTHHEPVRGQVSFDGDLNIAAFLETAERVGVDIILRIGPWCHGEVRHGGLPDWVLDAAPATRRDDPDYLRLVAEWFARLGSQVSRFCGPDGRIIGIQLENELYDQPGHILTLKRLAREAGLSAPLWTSTAWGGALLPPHEVFPLYGGYSDGFWADQGAAWDDSFREHFRFAHVWDDPGVGSDQREKGTEIVVRDIDPEFPPATCELGGGMATAYHRRPIARALDLAAVANIKIGNGSLWQGFYMYVGGINPVDDVQESHATGSPNDLPRFDYDFQSPVGATGRAGSSLGVLRDHNAFLAAFGDRLARMVSSLPDEAPVDVRDLHTLRWAVRSDGESGFLFINTHEPHEPLAAVADVQFCLELGGDELVVPDRPIEIPSGVVARWPLRLELAGVRIEWATASVAGAVGGDVPTLVLRAHDGIPARVSFGAGSTALIEGSEVALDGPRDLVPGAALLVNGALRVLVVDEVQAQRLWYLGNQLLDSDDILWIEDGGLVVRSEQTPNVRRWVDGGWQPLAMVTESAPGVERLELRELRAAGDPPARYGVFQGRSSAPTDAQLDEVAAVWSIQRPGVSELREGDRVELVVDWEGDVAQLRADGIVIRDRFWDGLAWRIDLTDVAPNAELTLHVAPITAESVIDLDEEARSRVDAAGRLCAVLRVEAVVSSRWHEAPPNGRDLVV